MMGSNRVIVAAAGSGKTTYLVQEALKVLDGRVLITTYTESNEAEIKRKFIEIKGYVPQNVVVTTWFSFLITHGVKPFQGALFSFSVQGMWLVTSRSGLRYRTNGGQPVYWGEDNFEQHYFDSYKQIYSDKLAKLVIKCDQASAGAVFERIGRIFDHVFVDEVQDLAGYDLDVLVSFFKSKANVILVGDPRQVTYLTHHEAKYAKYANGGILDFLKDKLPKKIRYEIDEKTLNVSHRNGSAICSLSSRLYPQMNAVPACQCSGCRAALPTQAGLFIVRRKHLSRYLSTYQPMQLRDRSTSVGIDTCFPAKNFGDSKGLGFDRVLIFPTKPMLQWLRDTKAQLAPQTRARFYVALTRARYSVAIVADLNENELPNGFSFFE